MFSGDCYHTEIKIYLKQQKNPAESITKFYKQSHTCIKVGVHIIHGTHPKVKSTH